MRGYDEIEFVDGENGVHTVFYKGHYIGLVLRDRESNEYYFDCDIDYELALYAGHLDVILAKLIELNQETKQ